MPKILLAKGDPLTIILSSASFFIILLLFYWQVVTKGLVRYGEILARFYLDALPGEQGSIESAKRDGLLNSESAADERKKLLSRSIQLGSLDACLRLTTGNLFLIISVTLILFSGRIFLNGESGSSWMSQEIVLKAISESLMFGCYLFFDSILFLLPLIIAINNINSNSMKFFNSEMVLKVVLYTVSIIVGMLALHGAITGMILWESCLIISLFLLVVRYTFHDRSVFEEEWIISRSSDTYTIEADTIEDSLVDIDIQIPIKILRESSLTSHFLVQELVEEITIEKKINAKKIKCRFTEADELVVVSKNINRHILIPSGRIPVNLASSFIQFIQSENKTLEKEGFPDLCFLEKDVFFALSENNVFFKEQKRSYAWLIHSCIVHVEDSSGRKSLDTDQVMNELHQLSLRHSNNPFFVDSMREIGTRKVFEFLKILEKHGIYSNDISSVLNALVLSEDESEALSNFIHIAHRKGDGFLQASDGEIRVVMISDNTWEKIDESFDNGESGIENSSFTQAIGHLSEIVSTLKFKNLLPLIVLVPEDDFSWFNDFVNEVQSFTGKNIVINREHLPASIKYQPLATI